MQRVDADEDNIVVLIDQLDRFLYLSVHFGAYQAAELSDAMIDMHDIIACRELVQLLQRQRDFSAPCLLAFQVEFVETVE